MARIEVPMPQMGESIAEGTVSKWLKQPGDAVDRDEPVLEISTDKVDAEIPSPAAGTLAEIVVGEGQTVEVGVVLGYVESGAGQANGAGQGRGGTASRTSAEGGASAGPGAKGADGIPEAAAPSLQPVHEATARSDSSATEQTATARSDSSVAQQAAARPGTSAAEQTATARSDTPATGQAPASDMSAPEQTAAAQPAGEASSSRDGGATREERLRTRSTPVVRRIAEAEGIDLASVPGTGHLGRVTKSDILSFVEAGADGEGGAGRADEAGRAEGAGATDADGGGGPTGRAQPAPPAPPSAPVGPDDLWSRFYDEVEHPVLPVSEGDRVEAMDRVRRLTARHMVLAKRIAPHVHSFIEIDFSAIDRIRAERRQQWAARGARVSYTAFVAWACVRLLQDFPTINGAVSGNSVVYRGSVNLGMAVDLDPGLIVPVIHDASALSLAGMGKKIVDLADRARNRRLVPSEIQGGTFTITNPGVLGTIVGMPVIPQGTAAILGTGAIEKRVVVLADSESGQDVMAIRKRAYFSLGYDHRIVDGADAARFLAQLKQLLENFPAEA